VGELDMTPNKQTIKFLKRKKVQLLLKDKELTNSHILRLNTLFSKSSCKNLENMHETIAKFVLYDLNNYSGRLRRLKGIPGTTPYTQLIRYGKKHFKEIILHQSERKTFHFQNTQSYWLNLGFSYEESCVKVSEIQKNRSARSPAIQKETRSYSNRCVDFWIKKGYSEEEAKKAVSDMQRRKHSKERNDRWQQTLNSKSDEEKALINAKKGHSVEAFILRGYSEADAIAASNAYYQKRKNYSNLSQTFFSLLESLLGSQTVYYKVKNYEKQFNGRCVDFYDVESKIVVEFYGDFWHRNPKKYSEDYVCYGKTSKEIWNLDEARISLIKQHDLVSNVLIVWEYDVSKNPQAVAESLIKEIKNARN
jgi:polyhydroxyalkanoate synthesis regulator phasin